MLCVSIRAETEALRFFATQPGQRKLAIQIADTCSESLAGSNDTTVYLRNKVYT